MPPAVAAAGRRRGGRAPPAAAVLRRPACCVGWDGGNEKEGTGVNTHDQGEKWWQADTTSTLLAPVLTWRLSHPLCVTHTALLLTLLHQHPPTR